MLDETDDVSHAFHHQEEGVTAPNRFIVLLYAGLVSLALGVVSPGIGSVEGVAPLMKKQVR